MTAPVERAGELWLEQMLLHDYWDENQNAATGKVCTAVRELLKLRSLLAASKWQPIESAPRDGRGIIGWMSPWADGGEVHWGGLEDDGGWYLAGNDPTDSWGPGALPVTHWQPLPSPPLARSGATFSAVGASQSGEA